MTREIAVIAAHPDDEVLGCGGTIARFVQEGSIVRLLVMSNGVGAREFESPAEAKSQIERRNRAARNAFEMLGCESIEILDLPDNAMDSLPLIDIIRPIEKFINHHKPQCVLTHYGGDLNVDHRLVHEAVITSCRPLPRSSVEELLYFEVLSSSEWHFSGQHNAFQPNWFIDITSTLTLKLKAIQLYEDELREFPHPRSLEAIEALARFRGATAGVLAAEGFVLGRKVSLGGLS